MALLGNALAQEIQNTDANAFDVIPQGQYVLHVSKTELVDTKDKTGAYVKVTFDVMGPTHQGRKIFANFNIRNNSATAEQIGKQQLKQLIVAGHVQEPLQDTDQLLGAEVLGDVIVKPAHDKYGESNTVRKYREVGSAMPSADMSGSNTPVGDAVTTPATKSFSSAYAAPASTPAAPTAPWMH